VLEYIGPGKLGMPDVKAGALLGLKDRDAGTLEGLEEAGGSSPKGVEFGATMGMEEVGDVMVAPGVTSPKEGSIESVGASGTGAVVGVRVQLEEGALS
jgi:hypothetical protein